MASPMNLESFSKTQWLELIKDKSQPEIKKLVLSMDSGFLRDRFLALWAVHYADFDGLLPEFEKFPEPQAVALFKLKSPKEQERKPLDWKHPEIVEWLEKTHKAKKNNHSNIAWLKQLKKWLNSDQDQEELMKIENKLYDFTAKKNIRKIIL